MDKQKKQETWKEPVLERTSSVSDATKKSSNHHRRKQSIQWHIEPKVMSDSNQIGAKKNDNSGRKVDIQNRTT